jgi:hypothetical protein
VNDNSKLQPFDAAWLSDGLQEEVAGEFSVRHVSPMVIIPSRICISAARIYLQPLVNLSSAPVFKFKISSIVRVLNRRHMHEESALEIFFESNVDARIFSSQVSDCRPPHVITLRHFHDFRFHQSALTTWATRDTFTRRLFLESQAAVVATA